MSDGGVVVGLGVSVCIATAVGDGGGVAVGVTVAVGDGSGVAVGEGVSVDVAVVAGVGASVGVVFGRQAIKSSPSSSALPQAHTADR